MMEDKLSINQYQSITANLARVLKAQLPTSTFKRRSIGVFFDKFLALNTDFESPEKEDNYIDRQHKKLLRREENERIKRLIRRAFRELSDDIAEVPLYSDQIIDWLEARKESDAD